MSDVVSSRGVRTFPLPKTVVAQAEVGRRWARAYDVELPEPAQWMSAFLASGGSVTAEVVGILATVAAAAPDAAFQTGVPSGEQVLLACYGGLPFRRWSDKIMAAQQRDNEATLTAALETMDYDEDYTYLGITDSDDDCVVRNLVRVQGQTWEQWRRGDWATVPQDSIAKYDAFELDRELAAMTSAALLDSDGLVLMFSEPVAWLPYQPIVAALEVDDVDGAFYYAVVDSTDQTAVMDVISMSPGPIVKVRNAGAWEDSPTTLDLLRSINPPPLVELDDEQLKMVLAQVDVSAQQAIEDPEHVESLGNEDEIEAKQAEKAAPLAASIQASLDALDPNDHVSRSAVIASAVSALADLRTRERALDTLDRAVLVAAGGADKNRGGAETLRHYWLYGKGALKIKWGTKGDWTRCYRQLSKYLGTRAAGYCQLRHKDATGVYTGDKRNQ